MILLSPWIGVHLAAHVCDCVFRLSVVHGLTVVELSGVPVTHCGSRPGRFIAHAYIYPVYWGERKPALAPPSPSFQHLMYASSSFSRVQPISHNGKWIRQDLRAVLPQIVYGNARMLRRFDH